MTPNRELRVAAAALTTAARTQPALAVPTCELGGQHVNPANGHTTQGKTGLMRCRDEDTGAVVREQQIQGRVRSESVYDARGRVAREREFDERGTLTRDDERFEDGSRKSLAR